MKKLITVLWIIIFSLWGLSLWQEQNVPTKNSWLRNIFNTEINKIITPPSSNAMIEGTYAGIKGEKHKITNLKWALSTARHFDFISLFSLFSNSLKRLLHTSLSSYLQYLHLFHTSTPSLCVCVCVCVCVCLCVCSVAQSCPTLCDPMNYSLPGYSVHGILQARILEWVIISFSTEPMTLSTYHWENRSIRSWTHFS